MNPDSAHAVRDIFRKAGIDERWAKSKGVRSICVVGSRARQDLQSEITDLDLIIITTSTADVSVYVDLGKVVEELKRKTDLGISPQLFTEMEFKALVSPAFLTEYSKDSRVILGKNINNLVQQARSQYSELQLKASLVKRVLFESFFLRQELLTSSKNCLKVSKRLYWILKNYISLCSSLEDADILEKWYPILSGKILGIKLTELDIDYIQKKQFIGSEKTIQIVASITESVTTGRRAEKIETW